MGEVTTYHLRIRELCLTFERYCWIDQLGGELQMLIMFGARRAQNARNKRAAEALIAEHGERAIDIVRKQIAATAWQIRDHAHWKRIEKHVLALSQRRR